MATVDTRFNGQVTPEPNYDYEMVRIDKNTVVKMRKGKNKEEVIEKYNNRPGGKGYIDFD